ncbi:hypothetical protein [Nonomuraea rubra]|uniref:Uncharacterized protein n=1 Tax=Nonomuraea rubra TaxID=46180 RepID=A0A7X0U0Z8_9ACTN|nr:hypothetical protein [Nonomuraea rubra]MBB6550890.1 hypothetical protein [Nonomuraea rubra]
MGWTQAELDVADVMIWLRSNHGSEVGYADIAAGVGLPNGHRLRRAIPVVRQIAANRGDRLERFMPSTDPARRRVFVTRYMRHGNGDELSAPRRDGRRTSGDGIGQGHAPRHRFRGRQPPLDRAHGVRIDVAQAADECITKVAGLDKVGPQVVRQENTSLLAQVIALLQALSRQDRQAPSPS